MRDRQKGQKKIECERKEVIKMTWIVILSIVLVSALKLAITCLPTPVVEWLVNKFKVHPTLKTEKVALTIDGKSIEGEKKETFIQMFNEATFIKQHYIYPGNEHYFLSPESGQTPIMIETTIGKKELTILVFCYHDRIEIVKQGKKKIIAYSAFSDELQKRCD
jgi:hypothetical protein